MKPLSTELICPTHRPTLKLEDQGQSVEDLQQAINGRLSILGIPSELVAPLTINGDFDRRTLQAVQYLQCLSFGLMDGVVGPYTWTALCEGPSSFPILSRGSHGSLVAAVQALLADLNFYSGHLDGEFGALTQEAVKHYQTARNLSADGIIRPPTWAKLSRDRSGHSPRCFIQVYGSVVVE